VYKKEHQYQAGRTAQMGEDRSLSSMLRSLPHRVFFIGGNSEIYELLIPLPLFFPVIHRSHIDQD